MIYIIAGLLLIIFAALWEIISLHEANADLWDRLQEAGFNRPSTRRP